ncbi:VOC family protein [Vibrio sp. S11_S32]|uniref:VOC family protein n=1 Tax=Vibrio sp. S11_S32 TaxID=2720225 RepID=UPI001EEEAD4B|nr:VOC family protein [Vibrio sp. S11_S32]
MSSSLSKPQSITTEQSIEKEPLIDPLIQQLSPAAMALSVVDFWQKMDALAQLIGLDYHDLKADHLAMRINDQVVAEQVHRAWLSEGQQISNAMINGRAIIVIQLDSALQVTDHKIDCLELPYPSDKAYPQQGWEHVEFVVPSKAQTAEQLVEQIKRQFPLMAKKWGRFAELGVKVKLSSPQGAGERLVNPTVAFKHQGVCIKLHPHSLQAVIASEAK